MTVKEVEKIFNLGRTLGGYKVMKIFANVECNLIKAKHSTPTYHNLKVDNII